VHLDFYRDREKKDSFKDSLTESFQEPLKKKIKRFEVIVLNESGQKEKLVIYASSLQEVYKKCELRKYTVLKVQRSFELKLRVDTHALLAFFRNLCLLLKNGYSVDKAIEILTKEEKSKVFKGVLLDVYGAISEGKSLSEALSVAPQWFSTEIRSLIHGGERAGQLISAIEEVIKILQTKDEINRFFKQQTIPSVLMIGFALLVLFFNAFFTLPRIMNTEFFKATVLKEGPNLGMRLMDFTVKGVPIIGVTMILLIIGGILLYRSDPDRVEKILLKIPIIARILFYKELFIGYLTLAKLSKAGVPFDRALDIVAETTRAGLLKASFLKAKEAVLKGQSFEHYLPFLTLTEQSLIRGSLNAQQRAQAFETIAENKLIIYKDTMKILPTIGKFTVMGLIIYIVFLIFSAVFLPYLKSIGSLMSQA